MKFKTFDKSTKRRQAPYVYKVIDKTTCRIYSLGPDSRDGQGKTVYQGPPRGALPIGRGDMVTEFSFK